MMVKLVSVSANDGKNKKTSYVIDTGEVFTLQGDLGVRANNPGNISPSVKGRQFWVDNFGAIDFLPSSKGEPWVAVFATPEQGAAAQKYLWSTPGFQKLTIEQAAKRWATDAYPNELAAAAGVPKSTLVKDLTPEQIDQMVSVQRVMEGSPKLRVFDANGKPVTGQRLEAFVRPIPPTDIPNNSNIGGAVQAYTSSGEGVQRLQSELKRMGFDPGKVDGVMGPRTKSAIKEFQKANGLTADGIVGPQTATVLSAMGGSNVAVPGSQNWRNVSGVAPAGVSISPGYNPNVGIGDSGNAAMSVTPRVPTANFRDPADPILNNVSPEQAKLLSRGLDMNVSREQSAKDVLIGGFGALLGKTFPMGSASAAPVANTNLSTLRRQIGFTDASRVAPAVPAAAPKPTLSKLTGFGGMTGTSPPRPASFPATTNTVRTDGTVVSGVGGAGQVRTSQIPEGYRPASALPYTPASIFSAPLRLTGPGGMTGTSPPKFIPPVYSSASPSIPIPLPRTARPATPTAPTKLTGFGGMTGTSFPSAAPIPLPRNARPVAPAGTALAATENVAGLKPASRNVSSYSGGSSSGGGSSSPATVKGSATGTSYNVGQTYTTGGGLKYVAQADGSFKKV